MASLKQPDSLFNLAHKSSVVFLHSSCVDIQRRHGSYAAEECVQAVHNLHMLLQSIPSFLWNDLCEQLLSRLDESDSDTGDVFDAPVDEAQFVGVRQIAYALIANERLTRVKLISVFMRRKPFDSSLYDQHSFHFWDNIFKKMRNITKLEFSVRETLNIDTVMWMFDVIGNYCQELQEIIIPGDLSPEALSSLLKCTKLRRITCEHPEYSPNFSRVDCKRIVESLPNLEYFQGVFVIDVLTEMEACPTLKLTHLFKQMTESTPVNVALAARICPNLQHLEINPHTVPESLKILNILADSTVNLTSLTVIHHIPSIKNCQRFFSIKGIHLLDLTVRLIRYTGLPCNLVSLVSKYCLNLKSLYIYISGASASRDMLMNHRCSLPTTGSVSQVLKKLTSLTMFEDDKGVCERSLFNYCLFHATNLQTLKLRNFLHQPTLNLVDFVNAFAFERLPELRNVTFEVRSLSKEMIQCVYENCPRLRKLDIQCSDDGEVVEYVQRLRDYVDSSDRELAICYRRFPWI